VVHGEHHDRKMLEFDDLGVVERWISGFVF
jgi:hypothetical protein